MPNPDDIPTRNNGAIVRCTNVPIGLPYTNIYFGIRNDINVNGNRMDGADPVAGTPGSTPVFAYSSSTAASITYTSTTSVTSAIVGQGTDTVTNSLALTKSTGSLDVVSTGGNPADNNRGQIQRLFRVTSSSFDLEVDLRATVTTPPPSLSGFACPGVYDPAHSTSAGGGDHSKVDLAFYYSTCGDGVLDNTGPTPEACDQGAANGTPGSCCTSGCQFKLAGTICNPGSGDMCDPAEACTGSSATCPADTILPNTTVCRAGSPDGICDPNEYCPGVADQPCPADTVRPNGFVCRAGSGDPNGSGFICDPDETCSGVAGDDCPGDSRAAAGTTCRASAGDCDTAETCSGVAADPCGVDAKEPITTECRGTGGNPCDVAEFCDGVSNNCPADALQPDDTPCPDGLYCNGEEKCVAGVCTDQADPCAVTASCNEPTDTCGVGCPASPDTQTCRLSLKSLLLIKNNLDDGRDVFVWKYTVGQATTQGEFANPTATANYSLCVYAGAAETLVAELNVPPGPLWLPLSTKGFKYIDKTLAADGVKKVLVAGTGVEGKTRALVKGKGSALPDPLNGGPLEMPVTVQLINYDNGLCWQGQFQPSGLIVNSGSMFKGKQ